MPAVSRHPKSAAVVPGAATRTRGRAGGSIELDPIITMNAGGVIQSASDSVTQVFGWTPVELSGRNVKVLIPQPTRSSLDRYLDRYRNADSGKILARSRRFDAVRKDGTVVQIELSMSRADLPALREPYFIGVIKDVSKQIDVGGDTPDARTRLQELVTEQTRALATANLRLQLSDRLASLGTLAAGLGHDMNNVLLPVRARLNALEHSGVSTSALNHVKAVRRSISYLQQLSDALHFLTLDPDGPGVSREEAAVTDLPHWWRQVGVLLRRAVPKRILIVASFPTSLPLVRTAPQWLTQAMLNLIVNASEACVAGRQGRIRIAASVTSDGKNVRLSVGDNGRGMTAEVRRRAFDLFFTTKSRGMGTGLGLPLVRKVTMRAGGHVEIGSELGKGTVVTLILPAAPKRAAVAGGSAGASLTATISALDQRTSALVAQILFGAGFRVRSGDHRSPGTTGLWITKPSSAALAAASTWKERGSARVLILIGTPAKVQAKRWAALGAIFIDPPDDFEAIRHAVGQSIESILAPVTGGKHQ